MNDKFQDILTESLKVISMLIKNLIIEIFIYTLCFFLILSKFALKIHMDRVSSDYKNHNI